MNQSAKQERDEKKILLLKMRHILQQIQHLQAELKQVVQLNQKLSALSFTDSLDVLNQTDPEIVKLKLEFQRFSEKNQDRSSTELLEIHQGVKKIIDTQLQRILTFCEKEIPIDKALIVKTAQSIRKSSKTIIAIESLLNQRGEQSFNPVDFSPTNQKIENKITYIDDKENTIHNTIKIIQHVSPRGEQNSEYQALIKHLQGGGSLDEIEAKFDVEQIEIVDFQETTEVTIDTPTLPSEPTEEAPASPQSTEDSSDPTLSIVNDPAVAENLSEQEQPAKQQTPPQKSTDSKAPGGIRLFIAVFSEWLNTPARISWKEAKERVLKK